MVFVTRCSWALQKTRCSWKGDSVPFSQVKKCSNLYSETAKRGCFMGICFPETAEQADNYKLLCLWLLKNGASNVFIQVLDKEMSSSGQEGRCPSGGRKRRIWWLFPPCGDAGLRLGVATTSYWWRAVHSLPFSGVGGMMKSPQSLAFPIWLLYVLPLPTSYSASLPWLGTLVEG